MDGSAGTLSVPIKRDTYMTESETEILENDELADYRAPHNVPSDRKCMSCGEVFHSEGWHNRLCLRCRKRSEPDFV